MASSGNNSPAHNLHLRREITDAELFERIQNKFLYIMGELVDRFEKPIKSGLFGYGSPAAASKQTNKDNLNACITIATIALTKFYEVLLYLDNLLAATITGATSNDEKARANSALTLVNELKRRFNLLMPTTVGKTVFTSNVDKTEAGRFNTKRRIVSMLEDAYSTFFKGENKACDALIRIDNLRKNAMTDKPKIKIDDLIYDCSYYRRKVLTPEDKASKKAANNLDVEEVIRGTMYQVSENLSKQFKPVPTKAESTMASLERRLAALGSPPPTKKGGKRKNTHRSNRNKRNRRSTRR